MSEEWSSATLADVLVRFEAGRNVSAAGRPAVGNELGVLKISAVSWGEFRPHENKALPTTFRPRPREMVQSGDVLISRANTTELVGAAVRVQGDHPNLMLPDKVLRLVLDESRVDPEFLVHALRRAEARKHFAENASGTSDSMRNLSQPKIAAVPLVLPPLAAQREIVTTLGCLSARSRRAKDALDALPALLDRLRQSILAAAFRGDLTADWREQNPDVEPASELLKRIRLERRKRWEEAELAKMLAKGKPPKDDRWKTEYVHPEAVDESALPELPDGWCWATVSELASDEPRSIQSGPFGSSLLHSEFQDSGVLAIGIDNVLDGAFSIGAEHRISAAKYQTLRKYTARPGDVLITVMATVGRCCTVPDDLETAIITKHVYRISPERRLVAPDYLMHAMRGAPTLRAAMAGETRGQTRAGINGEIIRRLPVPLAPCSEQSMVLDAIRTAGRLADAAQAQVDRCAGALPDLDRATLEAAFRGELLERQSAEALDDGD